MMTVVAFLLFAVTLTTSLAAMFYTLVPAMPRIVALLTNGHDVVTMPNLVLRDRRVQPRVRQMVQPVSRRAAA
jgi:uncharacterized protein YqfA (UPF0365 family)